MTVSVEEQRRKDTTMTNDGSTEVNDEKRVHNHGKSILFIKSKLFSISPFSIEPSPLPDATVSDFLTSQLTDT